MARNVADDIFEIHILSLNCVPGCLKKTIIGSNDGLVFSRRHDITWTNYGLVLMEAVAMAMVCLSTAIYESFGK